MSKHKRRASVPPETPSTAKHKGLDQKTSRRGFFSFGAAAASVLTSCQSSEPAPEVDAGLNLLGRPVSAYGERSQYEKAGRHVRPVRNPELTATHTPLQELVGTITPSSLHFERHHAGVPDIDPATHHLLIHGMVERPLVLTVDEIRRLPSLTRTLFLECSGNSGGEWGPRTAPDAQRAHGLASCSEWTGVPLSLLLEEAGVQPGAAWIIAEGADACHMQRSIPLAKAQNDILLAYGQNGEAIRPEQGYPLRLVIPGFEGNMSVKWLRRLKITDQPYMTKDETSKYSELMPDGKAWQFTWVMDAKSVITFPSGGQQVAGPGSYEISGLAWSGRGAVARVDVSTDGGQTWQPATLQEPVQPMAFTRFRMPWTWDGAETTLLSRCTDETGYVQPSREQLIAERGRNSIYHCNCMTTWRVMADGKVTNVEA
jgi:sulfane dehydrogenase subunit SoxC